MAWTKYSNENLPYVTFNGAKCYGAYGMLFQNADIEPPKRKMTFLESKISNGSKDITDQMGTFYGMRKIKLHFLIPEVETISESYGQVAKNLNGKHFDNIYISTVKASFSGRIQIDSISTNVKKGIINMTVFAQPSAELRHESEIYNFSDATVDPDSTNYVIKTVTLPSSLSSAAAKGNPLYIETNRVMYVTSEALSLSNKSCNGVIKLADLPKAYYTGNELFKVSVLKGYQNTSTFKIVIGEKVIM